MRKTWYMFLGIVCGLMVVGGIGLGAAEDVDYGGGGAGFAIAGVFAIPTYFSFKNAFMSKKQVQIKRNKGKQELEEYKQGRAKKKEHRGRSDSETAFLDAGLTVDRKVSAPGPYYEWEFYVDGTAKKFAFAQHKKKSETMQIFEFNKLLSFELQEDGATLSKGSAAKVIAGGLAFGGLGALAGVAGKKKNAATCENLILRIQLNDLKSSLLNFNLISKMVKKESEEFRVAKHTAEEVLSILAYIENNK